VVGFCGADPGCVCAKFVVGRVAMGRAAFVRELHISPYTVIIIIIIIINIKDWTL
jgi:hypothetical protein